MFTRVLVSYTVHVTCLPFYGISPNSQLSDRSGELLVPTLSSPLCALRDLVLAENFFTDAFTEALNIGVRKLAMINSSPLRSLDVSSNKICDRLERGAIIWREICYSTRAKMWSCCRCVHI